MPGARGVYFLANDGILDIATVFLNSFRISNPEISLCLIPFADDVKRLSRLRSRYNFSIWDDHAILRRCDEISLAFHGSRTGHFRKFAAWEGGYDEFVYVDCDTVVLENLDFVFGYLSSFDAVVATSDVPDMVKWVWKETIYRSGALDQAQISFAANTGFIASKRGCLTIDDVTRRLPDARMLAPHMESSCVEQPMLNYMLVTSGRRYTSLRTIAENAGWPDIPLERWAGAPEEIIVVDGRIVEPAFPRTLFMHWAGLLNQSSGTRSTIPHYQLWNYYRSG